MALNWNGWPLGPPEGVEDEPEEIEIPAEPKWRAGVWLVTEDGELTATKMETKNNGGEAILHVTFKSQRGFTAIGARVSLDGKETLEHRFDPIRIEASCSLTLDVRVR